MGFAHTDVLAERHVRLRRALADRELDAIVVTHLPNIFYLTNFTGSSAIAVLTREALVFVTDLRYVTAFQSAQKSECSCPDTSLAVVKTTYDEALIEVLRALGAPRVGFEAAQVPFARYGRWISGFGEQSASLVPTERLIEAERVRKDAHEVATLRRAAEMLSGAFGRILAEVQPGRTERQVAAHVDWIMKDAGFDRAAFDTIVASGPNGAMPHARPGSRRLAAGDLVVLDFGGVHDGYCVDLTRTVSLGDPNPEARRVYDAVVDAHRAGVAASRPGATVRAIDRAARAALEARGLGDAFGHGTGHGLGIEVHEEPWLRKTPRPDEAAAAAGAAPAAPDVAIEPGMVFTIEPGAYLPGWGGVRLEDDLLVTATGHDVLTQVPRELTVV